MNQPTWKQPPATGSVDRFDRWGPRLVLVVVAALLAARLWLALHRLYDPDEFQHLHAGYCVRHGMVPYRDFFEQHQPVLWYLSLPLFAAFGDSMRVLTAGRLIMWVVSVLSTLLTWKLARRFCGGPRGAIGRDWGGAVAVLLLVTLPPYQEKNIEWRPDNLAVPLVVAAVLALSRLDDERDSRRGVRWGALAGAALAAAFCCTQKVVYVGGGIALGAIAACSSLAPNVRRIGALAAIGGAAAVLAAALLFVAAMGSIPDYLRMTLLVPMQWQKHERATYFLGESLAGSPLLWGLSAGGAVIATWHARRGSAGPMRTMVVVGGAVAHLLGLLHVPAAFHQYYLPLAPLLAVLGARALVEFAGWNAHSTGPSPPRSLRHGAAMLAVLVIVVALLVRFDFVFFSKHSRTQPGSMFVLEWSALVILVCAAVASIVAARFGTRGYQRLAVASTLVSVVAFPAPLLARHFPATSDSQDRMVAALLDATSPDDRFFDGFTGYAALRPHAFFYWWINQHSWPMIPIEQQNAGVLAAIDDPRTRVVLYDKYLKRLPAQVQQRLKDEFEPDLRYTKPDCIVWVRRGRELPEPSTAAAPGE